MNIPGAPGIDGCAGINQDFHQANHAGVMDLNAGDASRALLNRLRQTFQKREVGVHVEPFGLKAGKAIGNDLKALAHGFEILQSFFQTQIFQVIGAEFIAQESGEFFILFDERVFEVGAKDVMAVIDAFQGAVKLAAHPLGHALAEDLGDFTGGHAPEAHVAGAFEDFADWEVTLEDEVSAIFGLGKEVRTAQVDGAALVAGELWSKHECPVLEPITDNLGIEPIRGGLQCLGIVAAMNSPTMLLKLAGIKKVSRRWILLVARA